jgi:hypothetical protein
VEEPLGLDVHQTLVQRFLHRMSVACVQCDPWAYLAVVDGPGFIFPNPTGFFPVFFTPVSPVAAAGCAGCKVISFAREVPGDGSAATTRLPWSEGSALDEGIGGAQLVTGPAHRDLSGCSVHWTEHC